MMDFHVFHRYQALADQGLVPALECSQDNFRYVIRIGPGDQPVLHCYSCNSTVEPGSLLYDSLKEVLGETDV